MTSSKKSNSVRPKVKVEKPFRAKQHFSTLDEPISPFGKDFLAIDHMNHHDQN